MSSGGAWARTRVSSIVTDAHQDGVPARPRRLSTGTTRGEALRHRLPSAVLKLPDFPCGAAGSGRRRVRDGVELVVAPREGETMRLSRMAVAAALTGVASMPLDKIGRAHVLTPVT